MGIYKWRNQEYRGLSKKRNALTSLFDLFVPFNIWTSKEDPARVELTEHLDVWHGHSIRLLPCAEQMSLRTETQSLRKSYHLETDETLLRAKDLLTQ